MKRLLVTGGAGFIGSNFIRYIVKTYPHYQIINLDKLTYAGNLDNLVDIAPHPGYRFVQGDICEAALVEDLVKEVDFIVHFAAETHVDRSILNAGSFIRTDVYGTFILLEAAKKHGIQKLIHISTDEVYGNACSPQGISRPSLETDPLLPQSPYAASKAGADRLAYSYWTTYGVPVVITRCSNNFGPYQYPEKLIPLFVTNALENKPLPVYGDGKNTRDWIFVRDHCRAIDVLLHAEGVEGEVFNIGAHDERSVLEITEVILTILKKPRSLINYVKDRPGHVKRHAVDASKIQARLGWKATTDFQEAMEKTVYWYVENENWWRKIKDRSREYQEYYQRQYILREQSKQWVASS